MKTKYRLLIAAIVALASCKKDKIEQGLDDGKSTVIIDLPGDTLASLGTPVAGSGKEQRPFHLFTFRFSNKKQQFVRNGADSAAYLLTTNWDIAFTKEYNSQVTVNSGTYSGTPGFGGTGKGNLLIIEKPYDQVNEAPSDAEFTTNGAAGAGWDSGNGHGWFFYSTSNHICVPVKNRTLVLKTATGKFAKLEMLNIYKGNPPVVTDLFWPAPYLTFRYYVQEDGSRDLRTK